MGGGSARACQLLEFGHVQPKRSAGVDLNIGSIGEEEVIARQAAADLPQRGGEGATGIVFRAIAPEELGQVIATLWPVPMRDQVGQQRLRLEGGRQGEIACSDLGRSAAAEAQPAQTADLQLRRHLTPKTPCGRSSRRSTERTGDLELPDQSFTTVSQEAFLLTALSRRVPPWSTEPKRAPQFQNKRPPKPPGPGGLGLLRCALRPLRQLGPHVPRAPSWRSPCPPAHPCARQ